MNFAGECYVGSTLRALHNRGREHMNSAKNQTKALAMGVHDLIGTTPRLCQSSMTPVALRGRGTTSTYNCFPATGLYFKSKVLASVGRGSTETTRLQHGSSMFGDIHAKGGGGEGSCDKHGCMAFLIIAK